MAYVILIPTSDEYHTAGLAVHLWWNDHDYKQFKRSALVDLQAFLITNPHIDPKTAVKVYFYHFADGVAFYPAGVSCKTDGSELEAVYKDYFTDVEKNICFTSNSMTGYHHCHQDEPSLESKTVHPVVDSSFGDGNLEIDGRNPQSDSTPSYHQDDSLK